MQSLVTNKVKSQPRIANHAEIYESFSRRAFRRLSRNKRHFNQIEQDIPIIHTISEVFRTKTEAKPHSFGYSRETTTVSIFF